MFDLVNILFNCLEVSIRMMNGLIHHPLYQLLNIKHIFLQLLNVHKRLLDNTKTLLMDNMMLNGKSKNQIFRIKYQILKQYCVRYNQTNKSSLI